MTIICFSYSSTLGILSQHLQKWFTYAAMRTNKQQRVFDIFGRGPESIPSDHLAALREQWRRGLPKCCEFEGGSEVKGELW